MPNVSVRQATVADAREVAAVLNAVIAEGGLTIFERPFSEAEEAAFIAGLGPRSALHVAEVDGAIVGVQSVDLLAPLVTRLSSIATMGTWLGKAARGQGIGRRLAAMSFGFAEAQGYRTIVIQVLAGNDRALRFYRRLGFRDLGVAREHVRVRGVVSDEVYLERSLDRPTDCRIKRYPAAT